jgi:hypothetical protein
MIPQRIFNQIAHTVIARLDFKPGRAWKPGAAVKRLKPATA